MNGSYLLLFYCHPINYFQMMSILHFKCLPDCVNSLDQCYYSKQDLVHVRPGLLMHWGLHGLLEQFSIMKKIWNIIHLLWFCSTAFCDCKYQPKTNHAFSQALNWLCVLALYPHWFIVLFVLVITGHCDDFGFGFMAISYDHSNSEVKFQRVGVLPAMENTTYIFFQWLVHLLPRVIYM